MTARRLAVAIAIVCASCEGRADAQDRDRCLAAFEQGQPQRLRGELRAARSSFLTCAADACPALLRKDCARALSELDDELPTIVLGGRDAAGNDVIPTAIYVDGERVTALDGRALAEDPGPHVIRFEHAPDAPVVEHVVLRMGERNRPILATFAAPVPPQAEAPARAPSSPDTASRSSPGHTSAWAYVAGGVGALGVASFAYFGLSGFTEKQHLLATCAPGCADAGVAKVRFDYVAGDVSLGVGLVSFGALAYLLLASPSRSPAVSILPAKDRVVVGYSGRF